MIRGISRRRFIRINAAATGFPHIVGQTEIKVPIVDRAVSTSGGCGFRFDQEERFNHLFNPANGGCGDFCPSLTVVSRTGTAADTLSMAFSSCGSDCYCHIDV